MTALLDNAKLLAVELIRRYGAKGRYVAGLRELIAARTPYCRVRYAC
jgi:hypothetical protein